MPLLGGFSEIHSLQQKDIHLRASKIDHLDPEKRKPFGPLLNWSRLPRRRVFLVFGSGWRGRSLLHCLPEDLGNRTIHGLCDGNSTVKEWEATQITGIYDIYSYIWLHMYLFAYLLIYLLIHLFTVFIYFYLSIYVWFILSIYLFIYLSIYLFIVIFVLVHLFILIYVYVSLFNYLYIYICWCVCVCIYIYAYIYT